MALPISSIGHFTSETFVNAAGSLAGTGTVKGNVVNRGTVAPGNEAPGTLTVNGYYTQVRNGALVIDIAGTDAGLFSCLDCFAASAAAASFC